MCIKKYNDKISLRILISFINNKNKKIPVSSTIN